ncbi:hypothetical protein [Chlorogloea sp. CCALA 695]|uniref:hypothetical protein n=1 Tax=Chlorogloea sp. CCALA 695 TaxID=2107693 RepID=UPI001304F536|nr:hypothetical protein [Chlorogloea sp. CCALA 695]
MTKRCTRLPTAHSLSLKVEKLGFILIPSIGMVQINSDRPQFLAVQDVNDRTLNY